MSLRGAFSSDEAILRLIGDCVVARASSSLRSARRMIFYSHHYYPTITEYCDFAKLQILIPADSAVQKVYGSIRQAVE